MNIKEIIDKIIKDEIKKVVFTDISTIIDNQNGYRNDGGMELYDIFLFEGNLCTISKEYEYMRGYKNEREDIVTKEKGIKYLKNRLDNFDKNCEYVDFYK